MPGSIGIIGFVGQDDHIPADMIEQSVSDLVVMCLACCQAEPDRSPFRIDNGVHFGGKSASGATETMFSIPLFAVAACWSTRTEVLSIIWRFVRGDGIHINCAEVK